MVSPPIGLLMFRSKLSHLNSLLYEVVNPRVIFPTSAPGPLTKN